MAEDIYNTDKRLAAFLEKLTKSNGPNRNLLLEFHEKYCIKNKLSPVRQLKLLIVLDKIGKIVLKPLNGLQEADFEQMNIHLAKSNYSRNTINDYRTIAKLWLKFVDEKKSWELIRSKELKKTPLRNGEGQLDPDLLPTDEEVLQLFNVMSPKYRAFVALTDGAGMRIGEAATILRKNLHFNEDKTVTVNYIGKTGRNSTTIHSGLAHYVAEWYNLAPLKEENEPLFAGQSSKFMSYNSFRKVLRDVAKKIGILGKRKVNPHIFRHRHATWALLNMPPVLAKKRIWNNASTNMDRIYGHFTKQQENEAYLMATGQIEFKKKPNVLTPRICFKCQLSFPPTAEVCPNCNIYLDPQKISEHLQKTKNIEQEIGELKADMEKILVFLAKEKGLMKEMTKEVIEVAASQ